MAEKGGVAVRIDCGRKAKSAAKLSTDQKHQLLNAVWEVSAGDHDTDKLIRKVAQRLDRCTQAAAVDVGLRQGQECC